MRILAGDIGGTKTVLALFERERAGLRMVHEATFPSKDHDSLESIVERFLATVGVENHPSVASFGVAGPVVGQRAHITNLPWVIDAAELGKGFALPEVHLLNDLESTAVAVPHLHPAQVVTLRAGQPKPHGTIAVVAPGTGLGEALLVWAGSAYQALPTEGGHASFAPVTDQQVELLRFLERRFGHVSFERVCSGTGVPNLYEYLLGTNRYDEPDWLKAKLQEVADPTPVIMSAGLAGESRICVATLDLFVQILAGELGNMALKVLATGGLYLGGGICPRILSALQRPSFLDAICHKGRFSDWVASVSVHVILDSKAALHGAACYGAQMTEKALGR